MKEEEEEESFCLFVEGKTMLYEKIQMIFYVV